MRISRISAVLGITVLALGISLLAAAPADADSPTPDSGHPFCWAAIKAVQNWDGGQYTPEEHCYATFDNELHGYANSNYTHWLATYYRDANYLGWSVDVMTAFPARCDYGDDEGFIWSQMPNGWNDTVSSWWVSPQNTGCNNYIFYRNNQNVLNGDGDVVLRCHSGTFTGTFNDETSSLSMQKLNTCG